jgi:uncharacterized protein YprB with RNaseH-like and TPR domain
VIESTFLHCPGVGTLTEKRLWQAGVADWNAYLERDGPLPFLTKRSLGMRDFVEESVLRLERRDSDWFASVLPQGEHWRLYPAFSRRIAYLDIETTGGLGPNDLTMVGLYDGLRVRQFVKGDNLAEFPEAIQGAELIVSFFGTGFDLPFLRRSFGIEFAQPHIDLCYALQRLGYKGGLKSIERDFGLRRSEETRGLDGWDAVRLWNEYRSGREASLQTLLAYNAEDVANLEVLLEAAYPRLERLARTGVDLRLT